MIATGSCQHCNCSEGVREIERQKVRYKMESRNSILIVDDEEANLLYLSDLLSGDYTIFTARDTADAIDKAEKYHVDLILLDFDRPGAGEYEALTAIKGSENIKDIPVILITGSSSSEDEQKGLDLGADDYVAKPFSDAVIKLRVRNQIRIVNQIRAIERLSTIDQLTEIANKRSFNKQLGVEWRRAIRNQLPLSVLMIDVDRFKNYNDTYGHLQGDVALQAIAGTLTQTLKRPADFAARWGGEEFAVLLPSTDIDGAMLIAELIRESIENTSIPCSADIFTHVTVSIGANARLPAQNDSMNDFIHCADMALYAAKETGRNKVCRA